MRVAWAKADRGSLLGYMPPGGNTTACAWYVFLLVSSLNNLWTTCHSEVSQISQQKQVASVCKQTWTECDAQRDDEVMCCCKPSTLCNNPQGLAKRFCYWCSRTQASKQALQPLWCLRPVGVELFATCSVHIHQNVAEDAHGIINYCTKNSSTLYVLLQKV